MVRQGNTFVLIKGIIIWLKTHRQFDNVSQARARKLACIGYTNLILTGNPTVLNRLPNLMAIWSDVGPEMKESDGSE